MVRAVFPPRLASCPTLSAPSRSPAFSTSRPICPANPARRAAMRSSFRPMKARWAPAPRRSRRSAPPPSISKSTPRARRSILRTALAEVHGIDPDRIVCGNGSDDLLHLLAQTYLGEGDEAVMNRYGFSVYPIITKATGAKIVMVEETDYTADVDLLLAAVTRQDQGRLAGQSEQSHRHLSQRCRGAAAACRAAARHPAGHRQRLCRICHRRRLLRRPRPRRRGAERRHGPHLLQDGTGGGAHRLDGRARPCGRRHQPHSRPVQRQPAGTAGRGGRDTRCRVQRAPQGAQRQMARLADRRAAVQLHARRAQPGQFRHGAVCRRRLCGHGVRDTARARADRARDRSVLRHPQRAAHFHRFRGRP